MTKSFQHPDYSQPDPEQGLEDNRTTLYWNPELYTGDDSKTARVRFFNSDRTKKLRIIVEGFDARGRLIHMEKTIPE
jgi:hypothetical protein